MVKLLVVDDERGIRDLLSGYFSDLGYEVKPAIDGEEAISLVESYRPHLIFLDVGLPKRDGFEVLKEIKEREPTSKVIMITGMDDDHAAERARSLGVHDFIRKPFRLDYLDREVLPKISAQLYEEVRRENAEKTRLNTELERKLVEIESLYERLQRSSVQTIMSLALALESKDQYTHGHSERVSHFSIGIATELKALPHWQVDGRFLENIEREALLHDIGKVGMPDAILHKPDRLTDAEFAVVKKHPEVGARILAPIDSLKENATVILHHHEMFDGRGYPSGLRGDGIPQRSKIISVADAFDAIVTGTGGAPGRAEDIPSRSRILSVADAYDAMTSGRTYRAALSSADAAREIERCSGTQFDPEVVSAFLSYLRKRGMIPPAVISPDASPAA